VSYPTIVVVHRRRVRLLAASAAALLVATSLLVSWHRASVIHGVCADHGDAMHLEKLADHAHAPDDPISHLEDGTWLPGEGDHHCAILAIARDPLGAPGDGGPVAEAAAGDPGDLPTARVPAPAGALYRLAPKTSPPV
jgi:hypothetical protein